MPVGDASPFLVFRKHQYAECYVILHLQMTDIFEKFHRVVNVFSTFKSFFLILKHVFKFFPPTFSTSTALATTRPGHAVGIRYASQQQ